MSLSMYQASVPAFLQTLNAFTAIIDKAEAHCAAKKIDPSILLTTRLFPDMFAFGRQIQIMSDFAKGGAARLAGIDVPSWPDDEKSFGEFKARIKKTIDFVQAIKPAQIDGSEARAIEIKVAGTPVAFKGNTYLTNFVLPNLYFHATTAYAILRANGVELSKRDFLGAVPGMNA